MNSTHLARVLSSPVVRSVTAACALAAVLEGGVSVSGAADQPMGAAVFATVSDHYKRVRLADGSYQPEPYAFGNGGCTVGQSRDESIDDLPFLAVAGELVGPLARSGYVACKDPEETRLLIMVHWGTTLGVADIEMAPATGGPRGVVTCADPPRVGVGAAGLRCTGAPSPGFAREQVAASANSVSLGTENRLRDQLVQRNAQVLGFAEELQRISAVWWQPGIRDTRSDILGDLEESRYFVVLVAYDFQKAWKTKKLEVLWSTRFSLRTRGNRFDERLPQIAQHASRYFGADSHGLVRGDRLREGHVTIGPAEVVGQD